MSVNFSIPSASKMVTSVSVFPVSRFSCVVTKLRLTSNVSSHSTNKSEEAMGISIHISAPSVEN